MTTHNLCRTCHKRTLHEQIRVDGGHVWRCTVCKTVASSRDRFSIDSGMSVSAAVAYGIVVFLFVVWLVTLGTQNATLMFVALGATVGVLVVWLRQARS